MNKAQIIENLQRAHAYLSEVPEASLNLDAWKQEDPKCGTLFCAAGHLTNDPHFAQFLHMVEFSLPGDDEKSWYIEDAEGGLNTADGDFELFDPLFGPRAFMVCFSARNNGVYDCTHPQACLLAGDDPEFDEKGVPTEVTDKALALWRLERQMFRVQQLMADGEEVS